MAPRGFPDLLGKFDGVPPTPTRLRDSILANLSALLGSHRPGLSAEEAAAWPHARDSVINLHVRDFSSGKIPPPDYAEHLQWAIQTFEPRLARDTLQVRHVEFKTPRPYWVFRVDADLHTGHGWGNLRCHLVIDLEGRTRIID